MNLFSVWRLYQELLGTILINIQGRLAIDSAVLHVYLPFWMLNAKWFCYLPFHN